MAHANDIDKDSVTPNRFSLAFGRGRAMSELSSTPVRGAVSLDSPAFCSTQIHAYTAASNRHGDMLSGIPDTTDPALSNLITHIAQQVGQTIRDQLKGECKEQDVGRPQVQSSMGQVSSDCTHLNLTGTKLVLQPDVREPPVFRGDGSDKNTVHEWEELMGEYLRKRAVPVEQHHIEIMAKLMGKAKDFVRITLRSSPSVKPQENPKAIYDILRQYFGEVTYSCMPMADFYSTVPVAGETPVEYWVRLNKAVDAAEEALRRLGRRIEDPCQEAAMMFVKYCPDPNLAAVFRFKAPDKWTASEIQEHIDRCQIEMKEQLLSKAKHPKSITVHAQAPTPEGPVITSIADSPKQTETVTPSSCSDDCMKMLINLFDHALINNNHIVDRLSPSDQPSFRSCRVCGSVEHSTLSHCRQKRLCLACFEPNHIKRNCPNRQDSRSQRASQPLN